MSIAITRTQVQLGKLGDDVIERLLGQPIATFLTVELAALPVAGEPVRPSHPPNPALTRGD